ncbi:hypothetical protein BC6307_07170 [Sutcliffiella cohnii]|uniref:DNA methylase adenine-specific domain-containing protein n=1 Tax=Sutcliffiella cohnii TaxID=33932 RepID=A0A223KP11_9BACI|nr:hypothetical protein BC6307_07170 [Sutcliffiella cohnii]
MQNLEPLGSSELHDILDMTVELMKPNPEDVIIDPAMYSAGFLVSASEYLRRNSYKSSFVSLSFNSSILTIPHR